MASGERSDSALMAASARGDRDAFAEVVRRHRDRLWAVALRTLGDPDDAADALQDALLSAWRRAGSYRGEAAVTTWLHRIVVNACLDRVRYDRSRPVSTLAEGFDPPSPRSELPARDTVLDVRAALAALPVEQRAALVMVDILGCSVEEAAEALEIPPGTVKSRCARGRARLAVLLRVDEPTDGNDGGSAGVTPTERRRP